MPTATLRALGGSLALTLSKRVAATLGAKAGTAVDVSIEEGRIVVTPIKRPRYTLAELLAQGDGKTFARDRVWLAARPIGKEVL